MTAKSNDRQYDAVDATLLHWRQGDCVIGEQWFVHRFIPDIPLTDEAADAASHGGDLIEVEVLGFVVVSQTCDLVRSCRNRPYVEIAPLVKVDSLALGEIERGRRPRYAFIPSLKDRAIVGDLDRVMTVEKAVMTGWERIAGCL